MFPISVKRQQMNLQIDGIKKDLSGKGGWIILKGYQISDDFNAYIESQYNLKYFKI
jgi:hypothetical protein